MVRAVGSRIGTVVAGLLRHAVAGAVVVTGSVALVVVLYAGLLLYSIMATGDLGGPLALPGLMVAAFAVSAAAVLALLLPVSVATEILCARVRRRRWLAEIVVATLLLALAVHAIAVPLAMRRGVAVREAVEIAAVATAVLLLLLGVYWWSARATALLLSLSVRLWRRLPRARRTRIAHGEGGGLP